MYYIVLFHWMSRRFIPFVVKRPRQMTFLPQLSYIAQFRFSSIEVALFVCTNYLFGKNGKFLFQLGYTPVVSDMKKIVQKTAALSFPKWALAVWDMDTATLYMVKYDRSH